MSEEGSSANPFRLWIGGALILFGIFAVVSGIIGLTDNKSRLVTPNDIITVEIVKTPAEKQLGLSGRESIGDGEGMLFVFDNSSVQNCFWMKDMKFSIDMIWLDEQKKVVTVTPGVAPESYPENFCPTSPAKYGLEVMSGRSASLGIEKNVNLRF